MLELEKHGLLTIQRRLKRAVTTVFSFNIISSLRTAVSMSRWHQPSCTAPDIFLDAGTPPCRACGTYYPWEQLASEGSITPSAPPQIPVNEPAGQLNLRWPPVVPYSGTGYSQDETTSLTENLAEATDWVIYRDTLSREEIRLARLDSSDDETSPVHLSLEKHMLANTLE